MTTARRIRLALAGIALGVFVTLLAVPATVTGVSVIQSGLSAAFGTYVP